MFQGLSGDKLEVDAFLQEVFDELFVCQRCCPGLVVWPIDPAGRAVSGLTSDSVVMMRGEGGKVRVAWLLCCPLWMWWEPICWGDVRRIPARLLSGEGIHDDS
jgi:hypothetical protein